MCRFCFRRQAAAPGLAAISNRTKRQLVCKGLQVPRRFATLLKKVANPKGVTNRYVLAAAPGRRWSAGAAPQAVPAGTLATIEATDFVGTNLWPSEVHKTDFAAYRVPGSFLHTGFPGMYALAPGCLVAIGTAPATGEVHPDSDASAILSRAASITSRLAASCDRSQDRPREQPVFPHLRRCRGRRCAICCRCAPATV
jgi:hypothetical protein